MEWFIMNSSGVRSLATGFVEKIAEDHYMVQDECADVIEELLEKIHNEDHQTSVTKRHLLTERLITKDLTPLVKYSHPNTNELALVYRLLAALSEPIDPDLVLPTNTQRDLRSLIRQCRDTFLDTEFVRKLFDHVKELIEEGGNMEQPQEAYDAIKYLLMFVRNILFSTQHEESIKQSALRSVLLKNDLGAVIIYSISCHSRDTLAIPVAQLLSQLYQTFDWNSSTAKEEVEECDNDFVNNKLRCLIVQLLQGSLSTLVTALQRQELREPRGLSYVPWCLAYFLPYINHVPVPISNIKRILSSKCAGYLVYLVSMISIDIFSDNPLEPSFQQRKDRLMLTFSALDNLLSTILDYSLANLTREELQIAMQFYKDLVEMSDLWRMLLLHIGNFDVQRFPRSFLAQLTCTNHKLFTAVEFFNKTFCGQLEHVVLQHFKQFATSEVIERYTMLVETYSTNSKQTNIAVFTTLCHICVDCDKKELLYTPTLLRLLSSLTDNMAATKEDRELANYVVKSFLADLEARPQVCVKSFVNSSPSYIEVEQSTEEDNMACTDGDDTEWSGSEESDLFSLVAHVEECSSAGATIELLSNKLAQLGVNRSKEEVAQKLVQLGVIEPLSTVEEVTKPLADISQLVMGMVQEGKEDFILWLQQELLTASFIKAAPKDSRCRHSPLCRYSILQGHGYPLIPYSQLLNETLFKDKRSRQLLDLLELPYQPFNGTYMAHIPADRNAGQLYAIAERLKSIETAAIGAKLPTSCDSSTASVSEEEDIVHRKPQTSGPADHSGKQADSVDEGNFWMSYYMRNQSSS